jgi:hypothetical protein
MKLGIYKDKRDYFTVDYVDEGGYNSYGDEVEVIEFIDDTVKQVKKYNLGDIILFTINKTRFYGMIYKIKKVSEKDNNYFEYFTSLENMDIVLSHEVIGRITNKKELL